MNNDTLLASKRIRDHLTQQKARAVAKRSDWTEEKPTFYCRYRGDNGTMCAVGCLIPNELYRESMEGYPIHGNLGYDLRAAVRSVYPRVDMGILHSWQRYHDGQRYQAWCRGEEGSTSPSDVFDLLVGG